MPPRGRSPTNAESGDELYVGKLPVDLDDARFWSLGWSRRAGEPAGAGVIDEVEGAVDP
jgi:hypothetical protein